MLCIMCAQPLTQDEQDGAGYEPWCTRCLAQESERHARDDRHPDGQVGMFTRPPKYVLRRSEWAAFGY